MKIKSLAYTIVAILLFTAPAAKSETVSAKQAAGIAESFFNAAAGIKMAPPKLVYNGRDLTTQRLFSPFYVYNHPAGGYVVISAENKTFPILGYSLTGSFEPTKIPEALRGLLKQYAMHAERIRYDGSIPEQAIAAWQNLPSFISDMLNAPAVVTDRLHPWEETEEVIAEMPYRADIDVLSSEIYTPAQWADLINAQLTSGGNVELGIAIPGSQTPVLIPAVITGRKGDYYRWAAPQTIPGYWRVLSTEVLSDTQVAVLDHSSEPIEIESEPPFAFYDSFMEELRAAAQQHARSIEESLSPSTPSIEWNGTGAYSINLPEQPRLARIYSITGALMQEQYFRDTNTAHIDISNAPGGIYFCIVYSIGGTPYSFKLYR